MIADALLYKCPIVSIHNIMSDPQYENSVPVSHHSEQSVGTALLTRKPHRFLVSDWDYS